MKNKISLSLAIISILYSDLSLQLLRFPFLGMISSAISSKRGKSSKAPYLRSFMADLLNNVGLERSSIFLNIIDKCFLFWFFLKLKFRFKTKKTNHSMVLIFSCIVFLGKITNNRSKEDQEWYLKGSIIEIQDEQEGIWFKTIMN